MWGEWRFNAYIPDESWLCVCDMARLLVDLCQDLLILEQVVLLHMSASKRYSPMSYRARRRYRDSTHLLA